MSEPSWTHRQPGRRRRLPPREPVGTDYFTQFVRLRPVARTSCSAAPKYRHHVASDETAVDMVGACLAPLVERNGRNRRQRRHADHPRPAARQSRSLGCGGRSRARGSESRPDWVIDLHNGGCASFMHMIALAADHADRPTRTTALIAAVQNCAGQIFTQSDVRKLAQAAVPGDGCGVGLLVKSEAAPVLGIESPHLPRVRRRHDGRRSIRGRKYWEPGTGQTAHRVHRIEDRQGLRPRKPARPRGGARGVQADRHHRRTRSTPWSPTSPTGCSCATGATHWSCRRNGTPTPSTNAGTCSAPRSPSPSTSRTGQAGSRNGSLVLMSAFAHAGDFAGAAADSVGRRPGGGVR